VDSGQLEAAVTILREGLQLAPETTEIYVNLASVYERLKRFDLAEGCLRRVLVLSPKSTEYLLD